MNNLKVNQSVQGDSFPYCALEYLLFICYKQGIIPKRVKLTKSYYNEFQS